MPSKFVLSMNVDLDRLLLAFKTFLRLYPLFCTRYGDGDFGKIESEWIANFTIHKQEDNESDASVMYIYNQTILFGVIMSSN